MLLIQYSIRISKSLTCFLDDEIVLPLTKCIKVMTKKEELRKKMISLGVLKPLVFSLGSYNLEIIQQALKTLLPFAIKHQISDILFQHRILGPLTDILNTQIVAIQVPARQLYNQFLLQSNDRVQSEAEITRKANPWVSIQQNWV